MSRLCPNCAAELSPSLFLVPRFAHQYRCPSCRSRLGFTGIFSWGLEAILLLLSYAIYRLVNGNLAEALVVIPIALLFVVLEYRFARIKVIGS